MQSIATTAASYWGCITIADEEKQLTGDDQDDSDNDATRHGDDNQNEEIQPWLFEYAIDRKQQEDEWTSRTMAWPARMSYTLYKVLIRNYVYSFFCIYTKKQKQKNDNWYYYYIIIIIINY